MTLDFAFDERNGNPVVHSVMDYDRTTLQEGIKSGDICELTLQRRKEGLHGDMKARTCQVCVQRLKRSPGPLFTQFPPKLKTFKLFPTILAACRVAAPTATTYLWARQCSYRTESRPAPRLSVTDLMTCLAVGTDRLRNYLPKE